MGKLPEIASGILGDPGEGCLCPQEAPTSMLTERDRDLGAVYSMSGSATTMACWKLPELWTETAPPTSSLEIERTISTATTGPETDSK